MGEIPHGGSETFSIGEQPLEMQNERPGPAEVTIETAAGSRIVFTVAPGARFRVEPKGDIRKVNVDLLALDGTKLHVVD